MASELVEFEKGTIRIALNLKSNNVGVVYTYVLKALYLGGVYDTWAPGGGDPASTGLTAHSTGCMLAITQLILFQCV
ncbi:hypothetical protein RND71_030094 [Anisodus tanguticus]|uniref:Uncharacterized protein n=1 Tax=Anisodus tanguticus TaxID=243964 RepID=A0AAE1RGT0_9SOLA|nr:hypothetical protein RND71_030094 [Anisodus tanguticus]